IAMVECTRPDSALQPRAVVLLHDLEEVGLLPARDQLAGARLHRCATRVRLEAAAPAAGAPRPAPFDDHVPDLAGRSTAGPGLAVEDDAAADAGAPPDAEQRRMLLRGAEVKLPVDRDVDVVVEVDGRADETGQGGAERERRLPVGEVASVLDRARGRVDCSRRADADAFE